MPMPVTITKTEMDGVLEVDVKIFYDERGFFTEPYSRKTWAAQGFDGTFVQDSMSLSKKGALRGMHYQLEPDGMGKLVRALTGAIYDVAVDLRQGSPSFGKWIARTLTAERGLALWIPAGFAHGFVALEEDTLVYYKCTAAHAPGSERALRYNDPEVGIPWPVEPAIISDKDANAPLLRDAETNFVYRG